MTRNDADPIELRLPATHWSGCYFMVALSSAGALFMLALTFTAATGGDWRVGLIFVLVGGGGLWVARICFREAWAKHRLLIRASGEHVELRLPAGRSRVRSLSAETRRVARSEIAGVETRLETYVRLGKASTLQPFVLRLRDGELIFRGEDLPSDPRRPSCIIADLAASFCKRFGVGLVHLGRVEGHYGGLLESRFEPPPWSAENLDLARQEELLTGDKGPTLVFAAVLALIVVLLFALSR